MNYIILITCLLITAITPLQALKKLTYDGLYVGYPIKKIEIVNLKSNDFTLTEKQSSNHKVEILKKGNKYYWKSRNNIEMTKSTSGKHTIFSAVNGSGYVKFARGKKLIYMEHTHLSFNTITYFGELTLITSP